MIVFPSSQTLYKSPNKPNYSEFIKQAASGDAVFAKKAINYKRLQSIGSIDRNRPKTQLQIKGIAVPTAIGSGVSGFTLKHKSSSIYVSA